MSSVIKSHFTAGKGQEQKVIRVKQLNLHTNVEKQAESDDRELEISQLEERANQLLEKASLEAEKIKNQAEDHYRQAMEQIEQEKANWEVEKQKWIEDASSKGYEEGYEQGKQEGLQEYNAMITDAADITLKAKEDYTKHIEESEKTILQLSMEVAQKIMATTLDQDPMQFLNVVKSVIKEAKEHRMIQVFVHPKNYELIRVQKEELKALISKPSSEIFIFSDDTLDPDGCMIETDFGKIDASVDTQLTEIRLKLFELLEGESTDEGK